MTRKHLQAGYHIRCNIGFHWPPSETILQHYEKMDDYGYPQGLSGEEILLEAKNYFVADVVEAMTFLNSQPPSGYFRVQSLTFKKRYNYSGIYLFISGC
jgi:HD-GYP domain-containing protein (c-di-GMP phosphodiesterase class II)